MVKFSPLFKKLIAHPVKRRVAKYYLFILKSLFGIRVIGITGSVGKTTTKEMIASVLSQKGKTLATFANIDPVYNIPTTILRATPQTRFLVLEMGVEYPEEMDFYLWLAQPDIGILTNIYWTHTEFLGDIEGVAKEKGKLIQVIPKNGWAILNADDERVRNLREKATGRVLWFGTSSQAQIRATNVKITPDLKTEFRLVLGSKSTKIILPLLGRHWVYSALAAAAAGYAQNIPTDLIKAGLDNFKPAPHRMFPIKTKSGALLLDDTYNSNPLGAKAAIDTLVEVGRGKKTIAVLGDMLELGNYTKEGHREVGQYAAKRGVDLLLSVGEFAKYLAQGAQKGGMKENQIIITLTREQAKKILKNLVSPNSVLLLKASRKLEFEKLVVEGQKL